MTLTGAGDHATPIRPIDIRILGPLQVYRDDTRIRLTPLLARLLLILVAEHGRPLPKTVLQERLYGREPDLRTDTKWRTAVKELRRFLGGDGASLISMIRYADSANYSISMDQVRLDADQHQRDTAAGTAALTAGRLADAVTLFEAAHRLWRSDALPELPDQDFSREWVDKIHRWRRVEVSGHAEALIRLGRHYEAIPGLDGHIRAYPDDDGLRVLLIVALYISWRTHEAAAACRDAIDAWRERGLDVEWLQRFQQRVLTHELPRDGAQALDAARALACDPH